MRHSTEMQNPDMERALQIGFLVNHFPVLSETFIALMAKGLCDAGHDLDIYPLWGLGDLAVATDQPVIGDGNLMSRVRDPDFPSRFGTRIAATPATFMEAVKRHGARALTSLPPANWSKRSLNLRLLFEAAMLKQRHYDVLHCQFSSLTPYALEWRRLGLLEAPIIGHLRGYDITQEVRNRGEEATKSLFSKIDHMIANSAHFHRRLLDLGFPEERTTIIPSAIDLDRFPFQDRNASEERPKRIIAVGRLVEKKGFPDAVRALAKLREKGFDATLEIIGDGPMRPQLQHLVSQTGLQAHVAIVGALSSPDVAKSLARSDLFVAPSVTSSTGDQDGPANTIKEAMAVGLPVVATKHGGIPELVKDGETGFLVEEHAPDLLADRLARLAGDAELRVKLSKAARRHVEASYSVETTNKHVLETYRRVMATYHKRRAQ